jgi:spermidine/putrescine transport system permease protein
MYKENSINKFFPGIIWLLIVYAFLYIPIVIFFIFSFNDASFPSPWMGFTFKWYQALFHEFTIWHALLNSFLVAITAVTLSVFMGLFLVFYGTYRGGFLEQILSYFYGNVIVPEIVLAVGLLGLFISFSVPLGFVTLVIAHTVLGLGYVVPILYSRYLELDYRLVEAAYDLGATPLQTFFSIMIPLLRPALISSAILVFILSFDDFVFAYFCTGTMFQTLPLYILSMLRVGVSPIVNALSTLLLLFSGILMVIYTSFKIRERIF